MQKNEIIQSKSHNYMKFMNIPSHFSMKIVIYLSRITCSSKIIEETTFTISSNTIWTFYSKEKLPSCFSASIRIDIFPDTSTSNSFVPTFTSE